MTSSGELATPPAGRNFYDSERFEELRHDWQTERSVPHASEFVGAALVNGHVADVHEAAAFLLREAPPDALAVRRLAACALGRTRTSEAQDEDLAGTAQKRIRALKCRVREDPRNALAWSDLAREYAVLGQSRRAILAMATATKLAPGNRFVLRAACALFVHAGDPERAVHLLRSVPEAKGDAWLMAAEIAASETSGTPPKYVKAGQRLLSSGHLPALQVSELAGALATEELMSGAGKAAKKLFAAALEDPTENAVAQAKWASTLIRGVRLEPRHFDVPHSFEARARDARGRGAWQVTLEESWRWLLDQPFAAEPAALGSYVAGVALGNPKEAARIARAGLIANPLDRILRNNLAVSLAVAGDVAQAEKEFSAIRPEFADPSQQATYLATRGLLFFRKKNLEQGRLHYERALELLRGPGLERTRAVAAMYLAREELVARGDRTREYLRHAQDLSAATDALEVAAFRRRLEQDAAENNILV